MERPSKRMRRSLNRDARASVQAWTDEQGVSYEEREQRKEAAREIERAALHPSRFASNQEEMAWLKTKADEAGVLAGFEAWMEEKGLDTPIELWRAHRCWPLPLEFARQLGPHMTLEGLELLTSLPAGLHVHGGLELLGCTGITSLPDGLHVDSYLNLSYCSGLTSLPDGLHVKDFLDLSCCTGLATLPDGMHINGDLLLQQCPGLTSLPDNLRVDGFMILNNCSSLTSLPDGLCVDGELDLAHCTSLASLPDGLRAGGDLSLQGCTSLMSLPDGLIVCGSLNLAGCTGLTSLPGGMFVDGNLNLEGCTGLTSLPDGLQAHGDLDLDGCTGITALPDCVLEYLGSSGNTHIIYLAGSGLPPEELARLQTLENPALHFHVSMDDTETFGGAGLGADDFTSLDAAAAFWGEEAGREEGSALAISPSVEPAYVRGVLDFLSKLRRAKEFNNSLTKAGLAQRVVQVLELLTGEDNGVREELQVRMADAVDTCSDKPMWALNQMQVLLHTVEARGDRAKLRALGMGLMRLEVVHRHVRKAMDAMSFIDDVCVYLRFEIALRESLQLPVSALEMLYPSYITITDESIDAAKAEALALKDEDMEAWLPTWSEWLRQDRVEFANGLDFSALKRNSTKTASATASARSLLGNEVTDPVRLEPLSTVWSLQDLMTHWVNTGMDLNNTPRDVDYMRLNLTKCI